MAQIELGLAVIRFMGIKRIYPVYRSLIIDRFYLSFNRFAYDNIRHLMERERIDCGAIAEQCKKQTLVLLEGTHGAYVHERSCVQSYVRLFV